MNLVENKMKDMPAELKAREELITASIAGYQALVKEFCTDKTVSLDERWDYFVNADDKFLPHHGCILHFDFEKKFSKNFIRGYFDRHQEVDLAYLFEDIEWALEEGEESELTQEQFDEAREEILAKGYRTFNYDW